MGNSHGAGLGATVLSSGVDVLAVLWVSVVFRVARMLCLGDSTYPISVPFRWVFQFPRSSVGFHGLIITLCIQSL